MTGWLAPLGHFHGDVQVGGCCCLLAVTDQPDACPDGRWEYYLSDLGHRNVGATCDSCGRPLVDDEVLAQARRDADHLEELIGRTP